MLFRSTLMEIREGLGSGKTVWGGIPSVALIREDMSDRVFEDFLNGTFGNLGAGDRLILGVSDNVPPDADLRRLETIKRRIEEFGPVPRGGGR